MYRKGKEEEEEEEEAPFSAKLRIFRTDGKTKTSGEKREKVVYQYHRRNKQSPEKEEKEEEEEGIAKKEAVHKNKTCYCGIFFFSLVPFFLSLVGCCLTLPPSLPNKQRYLLLLPGQNRKGGGGGGGGGGGRKINEKNKAR